MKKKHFNEEEANRRFEEKYGGATNPDRNPLFDPDGNDFTEELFAGSSQGLGGPETTIADRLEDVNRPVRLTDEVTELTGAKNTDELVDKMMEIAGEDDAERKLREITDLLSPDEQKHIFHLLDMAFGYDYDGPSNNDAIMAKTFQLDKIHEGEGAIKFNLTELENEAYDAYPDTLSKPVEISFYDLNADTYEALVKYRKDPENAPTPIIPEKFLRGFPENIDGHAIDREQLVLTGKFRPQGTDVLYQIGSRKEEFDLLAHETIDRIMPGKPVRVVRIDSVSFEPEPKEPKMIPAQITFQDGSAIKLTKEQGGDIVNGKTINVKHPHSGVKVSISYRPDSGKGVTVRVSEPVRKENNVIKVNRPKLGL